MALSVGQPVPDLTFLDRDRKLVSLRDFRGQPLLLVFLRHLA
jgi:peroxiredoxin